MSNQAEMRPEKCKRTWAKVVLYCFCSFAVLAAGVIMISLKFTGESKVSVVSHKKGVALRFIGFTSGTNHVMTYPGGIEAKVRKFLSKVGIQAEEQTYRIITPVPSDRLWILLRVNNTNELLHPDQLRVQLIQPGGVTNIQEFNLLRPPFTNKELFGFSVRLHGTLEDPSGTWIEIVARSTKILSRKFTNHLGTLEIR